MSVTMRRASAAAVPGGRVGERRISLTWAVALGAAVAFFVLHLLLGLRAHHIAFDYFAGRFGRTQARLFTGSPWQDLLSGTFVFIGIELSALALASRGRTRSFFLPALIWWLTPAFVVAPSAFGRVPAPIGQGWEPFVAGLMRSPHIARTLWLGGVVDLVLALAPAVLVVGVRTGRRGPASEAVARFEPPLLYGAYGSALFVLWLAVTTQGFNGAVGDPWSGAPTTVALMTFGLLLGTSRDARPWLWTAVAVPVLIATGWFNAIGGPVGSVLGAIAASWPWVVITVIGLVPEPLAWLLDRARDRPLTLVIAINVLNVADAVLSSVEVDHLGAVESNPLIGAIGLPAKIALVAALTLALARWRPRALVWPALAMLCVLAWHVAGLALNALVP